MSQWLNTCAIGDSIEVLKRMVADGVRVQMCVTSPPYWGLRDYGVDGQLGLEATPEEYIEKMAEVFRLVREVLANDGTLWVNMGDSYASTTSGTGARGGSFASERAQWQGEPTRKDIPHGLKPKDLCGMPWRLAFALQADGWYLRSDIIWHKPNPMPESVTDRPTKSHEYVFLLSKKEKYFYDAEAVREPHAEPWRSGTKEKRLMAKGTDGHKSTFGGWDYDKRLYNHAGRNCRTVWTIATAPFKGAHFATFPQKLVETCIMAGSRPGDVVLDPFMGSGTVAHVAQELGRQWMGIELNPEYVEMQGKRIAQSAFIL